MRYRFHHIKEASKAQVEEHVYLKAKLIEQRLATFQEDLVQLDVRLDHRNRRYSDQRNTSYYDGHLVLYLPGRNLQNVAANGHGERWVTAINEAFDDLEDQLDAVMDKLHHTSDIHDYQHRPSWEREGAELLGKSQTVAQSKEESELWMEEWDKEHQA